MLGNKWLLQLNDLVGTNVGVEVGLDGIESYDGAVGTSAAAGRLSTYECTMKMGGTYANTPVAASVGEKAIASWKVLEKLL